jgi:hypothetical protein
LSSEKEVWWMPDEQFHEIKRLREEVKDLKRIVYSLTMAIKTLAFSMNNKGINAVEAEVDLVDTTDGSDKTKDILCPSCGSLMRLIDGKFGKFWGCTKYPNCRATRQAALIGKTTVRKILADANSSVTVTKGKKGN